MEDGNKYPGSGVHAFYHKAKLTEFGAPDATPNQRIKWRLIAIGLGIGCLGIVVIGILLPNRNVAFSRSSLDCSVSSDAMQITAADFTIFEDKYESYEVSFLALTFGTETARSVKVFEYTGPTDLQETVQLDGEPAAFCDIRVRGLKS